LRKKNVHKNNNRTFLFLLNALLLLPNAFFQTLNNSIISVIKMNLYFQEKRYNRSMIFLWFIIIDILKYEIPKVCRYITIEESSVKSDKSTFSQIDFSTKKISKEKKFNNDITVQIQ